MKCTRHSYCSSYVVYRRHYQMVWSVGSCIIHITARREKESTLHLTFYHIQLTTFPITCSITHTQNKKGLTFSCPNSLLLEEFLPWSQFPFQHPVELPEPGEAVYSVYFLSGGEKKKQFIRDLTNIYTVDAITKCILTVPLFYCYPEDQYSQTSSPTIFSLPAIYKGHAMLLQ